MVQAALFKLLPLSAKEQFVRDFSVFCEEAILLCGMYLD